MDSSPQYVQMCESLPKGVIRHIHTTVSDLTMPEYHIHGSPSVRLPRLDYLLDLIAEHHDNAQGIFTLQSFKLYTDQQSSARHDWGLIFPTLEQMALCYVMHELHGLTWTGKKWEKEA